METRRETGRVDEEHYLFDKKNKKKTEDEVLVGCMHIRCLP